MFGFRLAQINLPQRVLGAAKLGHSLSVVKLNPLDLMTILFTAALRLFRNPAVERIIILVLNLNGWTRQGALNAPLMTKTTLRPRVTLVIPLTLTRPASGPLTDLTKTVPAPLATVVLKPVALLGLTKAAPTFKPGKAVSKRPQALLQSASVVMTLLFVRVIPRTVHATVVEFEVIAIVDALFLSVVICVLMIVAAGPAKWAQIPLVLAKVKWLVVRLVSLKMKVAARQTGIVWVLAMGLGIRFVRIRNALKSQPPLATRYSLSSAPDTPPYGSRLLGLPLTR